MKAIIWDMDGVLADTGEAHFLAWQQALDRIGRKVSREEFESTFGMANPQIIKLWLGDDTPPAVIADLAARKEAIFRQSVYQTVSLLPGVLRWLEWARGQGYRQAVASSGEMANIVAVVHALEVGSYFDALISGAFLPRSKPDPAVFLYAAAAVGVAPEDCLVIEDGIVGVEAAHRAGMRCLAVTNTHPRERLARAELVVDSLEDLDEGTLRDLVEGVRQE